MKRKNVRSLETIAENINRLSRANIIDIGELLLEAKGQCEHGQWLDWLDAEFWWSVDTAERYMNVATLAAKFRILRNLKLAATTLYKLADNVDGEDVPAVVKELTDHATVTALSPRDAGRYIRIGIARRRYGDHPDATLAKLAELLDREDDDKTVTALLEHEPVTDEAASALVVEVIARQRAEYEAQGAAEAAEIESLLEGPPPILPLSIIPSEPQKFDTQTEWEGEDTFADAVMVLLGLRTKPIRKFVGRCAAAELREVADFLLAIATDAGAEPSAAELQS
jgi:hypothetical protein